MSTIRSRFLGHTDEAVWRHQTPMWVLPADKCLDAGDPLAVKRDDRL